MIRCQLNTYADTCVIYRNLFPKAVNCHSYDTMHRSPCLRGDLERTCYFLEQSGNLGSSASDFQNNELHQLSAVRAHYRHLWIRDWYLGMSSGIIQRDYEWGIFEKEHSERRAKGQVDLLICDKMYPVPLTLYLSLEAQCLKENLSCQSEM